MICVGNAWRSQGAGHDGFTIFHANGLVPGTQVRSVPASKWYQRYYIAMP